MPRVWLDPAADNRTFASAICARDVAAIASRGASDRWPDLVEPRRRRLLRMLAQARVGLACTTTHAHPVHIEFALKRGRPPRQYVRGDADAALHLLARRLTVHRAATEQRHHVIRPGTGPAQPAGTGQARARQLVPGGGRGCRPPPVRHRHVGRALDFASAAAAQFLPARPRHVARRGLHEPPEPVDALDPRAEQAEAVHRDPAVRHAEVGITQTGQTLPADRSATSLFFVLSVGSRQLCSC